MFARCSSRHAIRQVLLLRDCRHLVDTHSRRCQTTSSSPIPQTSNSNKTSSSGNGRRIVISALLVSTAWFAYQYSSSSRSGDSFVCFELLAKEPVSSTASIFHLRPKNDPTNLKVYEEAWKRGIWNFHIKQPQLQIIRAYTPLPPINSEERQHDQLRFLIRNDPHGEMSSYLHKLPLGATIELRGPNLEYHITPKVKKVVFFAGGTGIAPALQVAHVLLQEQSSTQHESTPDHKIPQIHILWANKRREDCQGGIGDQPMQEIKHSYLDFHWFFGITKHTKQDSPSQRKNAIVEELERLKAQHPGRVLVSYLVDEELTFVNESVVRQSLGCFDRPGIGEEQQIIISGPDGFVAYLSGPKEWRNGKEEQGSLRGVIANVLKNEDLQTRLWKV